MKVARFIRTAGEPIQPSEQQSRARTALSQIGNHEVTFVAVRSSEGLRGYLVLPDELKRSQVGVHVAQAVGAKVEYLSDDSDELTSLMGSVSEMSRMESTGEMGGRELQVGASLSEFSRQLSVSLAQGQWVAATVRKPRGREFKQHQKWVGHQLGAPSPQHHSNTTGAVVTSVIAGAEDRESADNIILQFASAMNGFDMGIEPRRVSTMPHLWAGIVSGVLTGAAAFGLTMIPDSVLPEMVSSWLPLASLVLKVVAVLSVVTGVALWREWLPTRASRILSAPDTLEFPAPKRRGSPPAKPRKATVRNGKEIEERSGDYPLHKDSFMLGAGVLIGMVAPGAGAESGETVTEERSVPPVLLRNIGPAFVTTERGRVHMDAESMLFGVSIFGAPGSGKTALMRGLVGWNMQEKTTGGTIASSPGKNNALVMFESKEHAGVEAYQDWADATGDKLSVVDVGDESTLAIDIASIPGTLTERATFLTDAFRYAFGEDAIGHRSYRSFVSIFKAALVIDDELLSGSEEHDIAKSMSVFHYVNVLVGNLGDGMGVALFKHMEAKSNRDPNNVDLADAVTELRTIYERTPSQRASLMDAPSSKISQVASAEWLWSPKRQRLTWDQVLHYHMSVVVSTAASGNGRNMSETTKSQVTALFMFALREAIMRRCSGWEEAHKSVSIFSDELSLLAPHSPEVIQWVRDQGRAFGVRPCFATQRPDQLDPVVRSVVLTFANFICFKQDSMDVAEQVVRQLSTGEEGELTPRDILYLDSFHAAIRLLSGERRQSPFVSRVDWLEADRRETLRAWMTETDSGRGTEVRMVPPAPAPSQNFHIPGASDEVELEDW